MYPAAKLIGINVVIIDLNKKFEMRNLEIFLNFIFAFKIIRQMGKVCFWEAEGNSELNNPL